MANCSDVIALARARVGTWFPDAVHGQCVAMITGISRELGIGFNTFCRVNPGSGGAKELVHNTLPSGWHKVMGDPSNDANSANIFNSLPDGSIVIYTNAGYGHVAVKNGPWGSSGDTIQQNWNTDGSGGPVTTGNCGSWCQSGGAGFLCAWVSDDNSSSSASTSNEVPQQQKETANNAGKAVSQVANEFNDKMKKLIEEAIKKILEKSNTILPTNSFSGQSYSNHFITILKTLNEYTANMNEGELKALFAEILKNLEPKKEAKSTSQNPPSAKPQPSGSDNLNSVEDRVIYMIKKCRAEEPQTNPFGVAGLIGNFVAESGAEMHGKVFEAMAYCTIKDPTGYEPTCEALYDGWVPFRALYGIPLNESAYLYNGKHYLGVGLGQWTGSRCFNLWQAYGSTNMWNFKNQLDFAFSASEGSNVVILKACLRNSESADEGALNVYKYWERANTGTLPQRQATARQWLPFVQQHWND